MTEIRVDGPETLDGQPPSAKLVFLVLQEASDPLEFSEIRDRTYLPDRTTREALDRLEEIELIQRRPATTGDARCSVYELR